MLMVVSVDGGDERPLSAQKVGLGCDWSPDGKTILTEANGSLMLVPVDGGQPTAIRIAADTPRDCDPRSVVRGRSMDCLLAGDVNRRGHLHQCARTAPTCTR
jgi:hypothetical protein